MQYLIAFLEGIITFISPCLLPMLPVYISYFASGENNRWKTLKNSLGFVFGFSVIFIILGAFAGSVGNLLNHHKVIINIITGGIVLIFGLNFTGVLRISFLNNIFKIKHKEFQNNLLSSFLFGIVFSIGWTPCVGAFLGSALMLASSRGSLVEGIIMLFFYSMGLGIPFIISAILIDRLKETFTFIKKHYNLINKIAGIFLIVIGILMMTGMMGYFLSMLSF